MASTQRLPLWEAIISRTHVHAPFWVLRNRAAARDPHNHIDHDHIPRAQYKHERIEEEYEDYELVTYRTDYYTFSDGTTRTLTHTYKRPVTKTRVRYVRTYTGRTSGECDYRPLESSGWGRTWGHCEPSWNFDVHNKGRYTYYWHAGWGHSYTEEKSQYWGGARAAERQQRNDWVKRYNSGDSLEDEDDVLSYFEDHSLPFWW